MEGHNRKGRLTKTKGKGRGSITILSVALAVTLVLTLLPMLSASASAAESGDITSLKRAAAEGGTYELNDDIRIESVYVVGTHSAGLVIENDLVIDLNGYRLTIVLSDTTAGSPTASRYAPMSH